MFQQRPILRLAAAALAFLPGLCAAAQTAPAYTSVVVFGDSLSDIGNDTAVSKALYGASLAVPSPSTGYTNGRFTDGTDTSPAAHNFNGVWAEQLAALLPAHPTLSNSLAGGTDYAYGFATTQSGTNLFTYGPNNVFSFPVNNIGLQVSTYLATHPVITNKTLFIVWGGANDLIAATSAADIANAAAREAAIVQSLIAAGATDILVPNLPPLGLVPRFNGSPASSVPTTQACAGFNQALAAYLAALFAANPTVHLFSFDTFTFFNTIVGPPLAKGLTNVTGSSQLNSTVNPDTYLFWDDLHPTTFGHNLLAQAAFTLIGTPVATTTTLTSSNSNANLGASVTLTATVAGTGSGTPVGTLTFLDGTTVLASSLVFGSTTSASATFTTSALTAGTHAITAKFSGVNGYTASTSASLSEVVTAPALTYAFSPSTLTVVHGTTGGATFLFNPVGGYTGTAGLACGTPLPTHFSCSVSVSSFTLKGDNLQQSAIFFIGTNFVAALHLPNRPGSSNLPEILSAFAFPFLGIAGFAALRRRRLNLRGLTLFALFAFASTGALLGLSGCSSSSNAAAPGTYSVPVAITVNGATTTQNLSVIVQ